MREGLLWYDNDARKPLSAKVMEAAQAYQRKFGRRPDTCHVAPESLVGDAPTLSLKLVPSPLVRPHHFWVGVDDRAAAGPERATEKERPVSPRARSRPQPAAAAA